jgi:hypothetical protein
LGKFISDVFLCPDIRQLVAGEAAVKAERSEFILSLDGRPQPAIAGLSGRRKTWVFSFPDLFVSTAVEPKLSSPFHPHSW